MTTFWKNISKPGRSKKYSADLQPFRIAQGSLHLLQTLPQLLQMNSGLASKSKVGSPAWAGGDLIEELR
jgi:hypothetical protein